MEDILQRIFFSKDSDAAVAFNRLCQIFSTLRGWKQMKGHLSAV